MFKENMLNKKDRYISLGDILKANSESGWFELNPQSRVVQLSSDRWFWNQPKIKSTANVSEDRLINPLIIIAKRFALALIAIIVSIFLLGPQIKKA